MINLFWTGLLTVLLISGCGWDGTPTRTNDFIPLTSITISAVSSTIANGTSTRLTATGHYSGKFTRDITSQAVWSSGTPAVAGFITAAHPGRVTGVAPGSAVVTATVGSVAATYSLTVSSATIQTMTVTPAAPPALPKGRTTQFAVSGSFSDATVQDLTFDAAWSSDTIAVVTVGDDPASKGLAKAVAAVGSATISAIFPPAAGAGSVSGTRLLTVTDPVLDAITVTPANSSIAEASKTVNFIATGTYSDGTTPDITSSVAWASSLTGVATIATDGAATTVAAGTTSISATLGNISGKTSLTVLEFTLQITPTSKTLSIGNTQQMTVTATLTDNQNLDVTSACVWTTDAPAVASVSNAGLVTGVAVGTTTSKATYGGKQVSATITVQ